MDADLDTPATAFYVAADDLLKAHPNGSRTGHGSGSAPRISDAELMALALMQALLRFTSEAHWLRHVHDYLRGMFSYVPGESDYIKRLGRLHEGVNWLIGALVERADIACDDVWAIDSTPVECGRSRETARRSDMAGWTEYGYCASNSRFFWGLRRQLVCTLHGLPIGWALTGAKADERQTCLTMLAVTPAMNRLQSDGHRQILIGDKNYFGAECEDTPDQSGIELLRQPAKANSPVPGPGSSNRRGKSSSPSTTRSRASSTWSNMGGGHLPGSPYASSSAC